MSNSKDAVRKILDLVKADKTHKSDGPRGQTGVRCLRHFPVPKEGRGPNPRAKRPGSRPTWASRSS